MNTITITNTKETESGWRFTVAVDDAEYVVTLRRDYYQELTAGEITPAELIEKSFAFLLEREPKEAILPSFDVAVIGTYFSEYEEVMRGSV